MERKLQTVRKYLQCIGLTTFVFREHRDLHNLKMDSVTSCQEEFTHDLKNTAQVFNMLPEMCSALVDITKTQTKTSEMSQNHHSND